MTTCLHRRQARPDETGFSLVELMITTLLISTVFAIAIPAGKAAMDSLQLGTATRQVERELQTARLRAVSANRPMRLKLNCPSDGQYRLVEVTGVAGVDSATSRCDESLYGYPGPRDSDRATPEHDGPVRYLGTNIDTLTGPELEFAPDGTTRVVVGGVPQAMVSDATVQITRDGDTMEISVNALGRITLVQ
jgi:type II secretory pathway pseudopilin PulG